MKTAKRILTLLLAAVMLLSMWGCSDGEASQTEAPEVEAATTQPATEAETEPETTEPILEGSLYLTVSSITFSLVGDSEDVYLGVIPREKVIWTSEDPDVISVENGVLTAVGVGETVIHGVYVDREVSCTAGCLAQTREELERLKSDVLSLPKRMPPELDLEEPCTYFDNAAIVGDSITYGLMQHEAQSNYLGDILFLARGGVSMMGFVRRCKNIMYQGVETNLEDAVAKSGVERVYFLMGSNDVAVRYSWDVMIENWETMLNRIWEKSPDVQIVLLSSIPQYEENVHYTAPEAYNQMTIEYNARLRQFAKENGCMFIDLYAYVQDHWDRMPSMYNLDNYHLNKLGCLNWMKILRYYAQFETEGGTY